MDETEKEQIKEALEVVYGNVTRAAQLLGFKSRQTVLNKMDRYGIPRDYADLQMPSRSK
jgi:transcriptional regulator of acetoin/glycerol metabolism